MSVEFFFLLSGSAASSRHGNSSSSNNNGLRYNRNKRHRKGNNSSRINASKNGISLSHQPQRNGYDGMTNEHLDDDDYDDEFGDEDEDRSCAYWWQVFVTMLQKLGLLVWKNLLLRRRHYIVTALEIILPTLCAMILALGKSQTGGSGSDPHQDLTLNSGNETIVFPAVPEDMLLQRLRLKSSCPNCYFAYGPQNAKTDAVISKLEAVLQLRNTEFKPYQSEEEIEKLVASLNFNNTARGFFRGAVVFENGLEERGGRIAYKIRLVDEFHDTGTLFPIFQLPGPNIEHSTKYMDSGFIGLQLELDKILASDVAQQKVDYDVSLQPFPYPPFSFSLDFSMFYFILLPTLFVVGFIFMVPSIVRVVVSEKDSGIRELLKLNGLPGWMQWLGWMVNSMLIMTISITIVVFFLFWTFKIEAGAVLVYSDPSVWWIILFLYALSASSFCFFVSSFPLKPTLATTVGIILWLASYFYIFPRIEKDYQMASFTEKLGVALLPNLALYLAIKVMCGFEAKAVGAQWYNIAEPLSSVDPLTLGHVILMFLLNTTMYMFLTVYIENVFPSEYGVRKPWYYLFQARTWCPKRSSVDRVGDNETDFDQNAPGFETHASDGSVGVEIINLRKTFGRNKVAVNGVSARMYDGEIFALLGHNGAGKTTTISMLTGLFAPSGGTATVNGYDITTDLDSVRQNMGLCPQHNMPFDKLTVSEHLRFFGQLKGLTSADATKESKEILKKLQMSEKETTLSMALSGGQKRKLSLGIALIGGTKVVILDEPTSGMDPEARRAIWDLLLEMRGQRTILLTTHFMEEADVLGDRIGIMANGKLQCCGTPIFLKKYYGTGYSLKASLDQIENRNELLRCVQKHVSNASIKSIHNNNSSELILSLPTETATTDKLSEMFSELTDYKAKMGIKTLGLSLTTMDEVFLRVGELTEDHTNANVGNGTSSVDGSPETSHRANDERSNLKAGPDRALGLTLVKEQFMALLTKKYIYTIRKRKLMLSQLLMPIAILALTILFSNANFETPAPPPALKISLDSYKLPVTLFSATDDTMASAMTNIIGPSAERVPSGSTVFQTISDLGRNDLAAYRERHIIAGDVSLSNYTAMFNTIPNHAAPLAINTATNSILRKLAPSSTSRIYVTNHPFQSRMESLLEAAKPDPIFSQTVPIMFAVFMPIGLALLAASFIVFPIEERLCKAKQLQMMTGVSPLTYWSSAFTWDFFVVVLVICAMTLCFPIFQSYNVFTSYGGAGVAFLILLIYGYSAISFSYLVSLFSSTVAAGFAFVSILHVASGMILCIVVHVMEIGELLGLAENLRWIGRFFPTFGAAISTMRYSESQEKMQSNDENSENNDKNHYLYKHILKGQKTGNFTCTFEECSRQYQNVNAFKKHVKKKHSVLFSSKVPNSVDSNIQVKFQNNQDPVFGKASEKSNKNHQLHKQILRGEKTGTFRCTFEKCSRQYQNVNTFKKHVKKRHSVLFSSNVTNSIDSNNHVQNISSYPNQVDPSVEASEKGDKNYELHKQILRSEKTGTFSCNFEECSRQYQNVNAFKKHVKKKHSVLFSSNVSSVDSNNQVRFQNTSSYQNQVDHDPVFETMIRPIKTDEEVLKDLQTTTLGFLSGMHSRVDVNRTAVESTFKNAKDTVLAHVCKAIKSKIEHTEINSIGQKNDLLYFVDRCSKICDFVDSEYKLIKHLTDEKVYVAPEKKIVYCAVQEARNSGFPIPAIKQFEVIEIPLRRSLKQLFELPEVLNETLTYQKSLIGKPMNTDAENNEPLLYQNFVQGNLWRKYIENHADKIVIPFFLYCDDYGVNNQLGAHSTSQSICGVYVLFPTLPPQFQSKLENVLLMFIFYTSVLKRAGNEKTFKGLVEEINFVQKEGIDVDVAGKVSKVYFKVFLVLGDNAALNSILDYVQSFSAFYCCRFCRVHKFVMNYMTELDYSLLRDRSNYSKDIKAETSKGGIHEDSIFNLIDDFHILDNASVDVIHDFYENVAHLGICNSLKYFIFEKKYFTLKTLNSRKAKFNYGINDSANLAGPIQKKHLEENGLKASSSEMIILIQHLLTIIGDVVPRGDKVWLYLVNVVKIHDIIIYKEITKSDLEKLKLLITSHHKSYIKLFKDHLRPTAHIMLHYYDVIKKAGPLSAISTMLGEARHRPFKVTAESTCSRKNIPLTLAIKNQIVYANRLLLNKGFQAYNTDFSESTEVDISKLEEYASIRQQIDLTKSYTTVKQIHATKKVVIGMFAMVFKNLLRFFKILHILVQRETGNFMFVTQEYKNTGFDKHFLAYGIKKKLPVEFNILELKDLVRFPNESHFLPNGQQIIRLTHY